MDIQDIVSSIWTKEEVELLELLQDNKLDDIFKQFKKKGFNRSKNAIEKKRRKLVKSTEQVNYVHVESEETKPTPVIFTSTPKGDNISKFETTLVIPDAHVSPEQNLDRFIALGRYSNQTKPNNIIFMGDFGNFDSLSSWDAGKEQSHGKKYKDDIKACRAALNLFLSQLDKEYKPRMIFLGGNHCLDDRTELLTQDGWITHDKIDKNYHKIYSINPETRFGEWISIDNYLEFDYKGNLNRINKQSIDLLATDDHELFYLNETKKFFKKTAISKLGNGKKFIVNAASEGKDKDVALDDNIISLLAWVLTDGHIDKRTGYVSIYQSPKKMAIVEKIVNNLNFKYSVSYRDRDITEICGRKLVKRPQPQGCLKLNKKESQFVVKFLGLNKELPEIINEFSDRQFRIFLDSLIDGDGSRKINSNNSCVLYGKKDFINKIQIHLIKRGIRSHIYTYRDSQYRLNISFTNISCLKSIDKEFTKEYYEGKVWDLTVKFKNFMIRRNGKCHFTGNCEGRIEKYIETHAQLRGHMDIAEDLRLDELGFEYVPYKKFIEVQGVLFTHAIMSAANAPVSGKNIMSTIASLTAKSVVVGHHHRFETMSYYRHGADDVQQVLLCGLFSEHTDAYADGAANAYTRCICTLTHWGNGRFDVNQMSIERLKAEYL